MESILLYLLYGVAICPASRTNSARAICPAIVIRMSYYERSEVRVILSSVAPGVVCNSITDIQSLISWLKTTISKCMIHFAVFGILTMEYDSMNFKE